MKAIFSQPILRTAVLLFTGYLAVLIVLISIVK